MKLAQKRNRRFEQTYNSKGIELVILKFPTEKTSGPDGLSIILTAKRDQQIT